MRCTSPVARPASPPGPRRAPRERAAAEGDRCVARDRDRVRARGALDHARGAVARRAALAGEQGSTAAARRGERCEAPPPRPQGEGRGPRRRGRGAHLRRPGPDARGPGVPGERRGADPREPSHRREGLRVQSARDAGPVLLRPSAAEIAEARKDDARRQEMTSQLEGVVDLPAVTTDGVHVTLRGNVDLPEEIKAARDHRAEGVGLLRTEFLITGRTALPTEDEQAAYFRRVGEAFPGYPVVVRSYDLGGDKLPAPFRAPAEANPFLGWRAIRVCLDQPELFRVQVRAALRAAAHADIRLMLPLVTRLDEVQRTRSIVAAEAETLAAQGVEAARTIPVGVMVETPAAAVMADRIAAESDFISVGTNDLTQYTLGVDRGNARLADRFTPHDPSVLRLLKLVADAARAAGKPVSVCGELASEPLSAVRLIGLGYETLSVAPPALPFIKWLIRQVTTAQARAAADAALAARSADLALDILRFALAEAVDLTLLDPDARLPAGRRSGNLKL